MDFNILLKNSKNDFEVYMDILKKWQKSVNLISPSTVNDIYKRHILDSAQLYNYIPDTAKILVDFGSGAGFPAVVLSIINKNNNGNLQDIFLIESDIKKSLFLKEVNRILRLNLKIINNRIEKITDIKADIITARALTSVEKLLEYSKNFQKDNTICLFLKGKNVDEEIKKCKINCKIDRIKSIINSDGCILKIKELNYE